MKFDSVPTSSDADGRVLKSQLTRLYTKRSLLDSLIRNLERYQGVSGEQAGIGAKLRRSGRAA